MSERKSWASSLEAKQSHAKFKCLAHNLLLLFEQYLSQSEGLRDELEEKKQQGRSKAAVIASVAAGSIRTARNFINIALTRATQRTQRFIRWVRVWIYKEAPWRDSIARLRQVWATTSAWFSTPIFTAPNKYSGSRRFNSSARDISYRFVRGYRVHSAGQLPAAC